MRWWLALAIDVVAVVIFALIGRQAHAESSDVLGVLRTAWPFLAGVLLGTLIARAGRAPRSIRVGLSLRLALSLRTGLIVWVATVAAGMLLRLASGSTDQFSFVLVAAVVLGVFLLGWRLLARGILRARRRTTTTAQSRR